jgi:hypothetical protein
LSGFVKLTIIMATTIKAKFRCTSVTDNGYNKQAQLSAVYGKEGENADFAKATPSGKMEIMIDKETKGAEFFEPNQEYYLTFEKA